MSLRNAFEDLATEATLEAVPDAIAMGDVGTTLANILIELKIITSFLQQGLNVRDEAQTYRNIPNTNL